MQSCEGADFSNRRGKFRRNDQQRRKSDKVRAGIFMLAYLWLILTTAIERAIDSHGP